MNEERLPDYFRFDVRVDRLFTVRDNPLRIFVGLQNVTNRANAAGFLWNRRTNELQINDQLGIFPLIGMDWRF